MSYCNVLRPTAAQSSPGQHFVYVTEFNLLCFSDNARSRITKQGKLMAIWWCTYINIINDLYSVFSNGVHASTYVLYTSTFISYFVLTNDTLLHNDDKTLLMETRRRLIYELWMTLIMNCYIIINTMFSNQRPNNYVLPYHPMKCLIIACYSDQIQVFTKGINNCSQQLQWQIFISKLQSRH